MDAAPLPSEVARDSSARDGEDRFVIPLEVWRASRDYKEFDVTATADLGWRAEILDATAPETARPLLTTGTPPDLPELLLVVTRDSAREPEVAGLLRVRVTFRDRAGALGDTALTFQFVDAALWNLIDSSSANTYYCKSDTVDLTVHDLIVALQAWQAGPQNGQNGDADEMSLIGTTTLCSSSAGCSPGEVCAGDVSNICYSGDPHGSNLRDWIRYLPSGVQSAAVSSIISQECVGIEDNAYPFRGGYHGD